MRLTYLGGADEIGASSTLVELAGRRLLVDCGIRLSPRQGEILPWLARVEELGGLDAIVLTHAHLDHSGGIPVAYQSFRAPIYMTPPTLALVTTLLLDGLRLMELGMAEGELPVYSQPMLEQALAAVRVVPFLSPLPLFEDIELTFHPAGHILGAASVALESSDGSALLSGDISATEQLAVSALKLPGLRPDVLMIESTYGNRAHASRAMEEERLIGQVGEVIRRRGAVLIPAFAIGRAQEVLLILSKAMERGQLPRAPILADGMVKQVCAIYTSFAEYASPWFQARAKKLRNPFFYENGPVRPIWDPKERAEAAAQRPVVLVASSGMLSGGPSQLYARLLAQDPNSFIAFTGYQDEESPGRKIQEVAAAGGGELTLGQSAVRLACQVGTYGLSAHSDATQLLAEIEALSPRELVLVHGYKDAKEKLTEKLSTRSIERVHCPKLGDTIEITPRTRRERRLRAATAREGAPRLDAPGLKALGEKLLARDSTSRTYTLQELLLEAGYAPEELTKEEMARVSALLASKDSPLKPDAKQKFLYRLRVAGGQVTTPRLAETIPNGSQQPVLDAITRAFPPEAGLYKKSVILASRSIVLHFHFPKVAEARYRAKLDELQTTTPWRLVCHKEPHQQALLDAARRCVPPDWGLVKSPALHLARGLVEVTVARLDPARTEALQQSFEEETGFALAFRLSNGPAPGSPERARMEINQAYGRIREGFAEAAHAPLKMGLKTTPEGEYIEVAFVSPEIGARYRALLSSLGEAVGYELRVKQTPDQHQMKELAKRLLPPGLALAREPSIDESARVVELRVKGAADLAPLPALAEDFTAKTGYTLRIVRA